MNADKLYRENEKMIRGMVAKATNGTMNVEGYWGEEKDELLSEANLIFCECFNSYDETKGSFSKYLSTSLFNQLLYVVHKKKMSHSMRFKNVESTQDVSFEKEVLEDKVMLDIEIGDVSIVAKDIIRTLYDPKETMRTLSKHSIKLALLRHGFNRKEITGAFRELTKVFS